MATTLHTLAPFLAGLAGGTLSYALARRSNVALPDRPGWRRVTASEMHWFGLVGGGAIVALCLYVRLFVGSARADAATQMMWLTLIIVGFSACIVGCAVQMRQLRLTAAEWRGTKLAWTDETGIRQTRDMTEIAEMERPTFGRVRIVFGDGALLRLDPFARGMPELWDRIVAINGDGEAVDAQDRDCGS